MWMIIRKYRVVFLIISYKITERPTPYHSSMEGEETSHPGHSKSTDFRGQLSVPAQDLGNFPRPIATGQSVSQEEEQRLVVESLS
jgi:hypothetical protein